ncbi:hypothetical protein O6H91_22G043400 [Diphasiastrum complanatum]|nr:hypothetical protein O6H91_22G043400 [Diphasiastrum complanatum]
MFPQLASTADTLTKVSSLVSGVGTDAHIYDDPEDGNIPTLLASKYDAEKAQGMKRLIALMSQGQDVSNFFPQVVKNVASQSLEVKKLVYIYLVHYAEQRPDEALLSINTFQRDLSDINPLVRAWALRSMSGIRVRVVVPLVVIAVSKCARDPSPYVRRSAANAILKLTALDHELQRDRLEELAFLLLSDSSAAVVGAAAAAFMAVCPEHLSLLGPRFRKLCELLSDVEEWGQVVLMDILIRYVVARYGLPSNSAALTNSWSQWTPKHVNLNSASSLDKDDISHQTFIVTGKGADEDRETIATQTLLHTKYHNAYGSNSRGKAVADSYQSASSEEAYEDNRDVRSLLQCTLPLLSSRNSGVVVAASAIHWMLAAKQEIKIIIKPLLFLLRSSPDSQYVVLSNIAMLVEAMPDLFENQYEDLFIRASDADHVRALKLDILVSIATESSISAILQEFQAYVRDPNREFAAQTVNAIGRCALRLTSITSDCMKGLLMLATNHQNNLHVMDETNREENLSDRYKVLQKSSKPNAKKGEIEDKYSKEAMVVTEAVLAISAIIQKDPVGQEKEFAWLIHKMDLIRVPAARAVVIWMVGEHSSVGTHVPGMVPVVLRYLAASFTRESDETKLQILNTTAKVALRSQATTDKQLLQTVLLVLEYVLNLGIHDSNYDIRDRACMLRRLLICLPRHISDVDRMDYALSLTESTNGSVDLIGKMSIDKGKKTLPEPMDTHLDGDPYYHDVSTYSFCSCTGKGECSNVLTELAKSILLFPKPVPVLPTLSAVSSRFLLGSMSHIVQHTAPGYRPLPDLRSIPEGGSSPNMSIMDTLQFKSASRQNDKFAEDSQSTSNDVEEENSIRSYSAESGDEENNYRDEEYSDGSSYRSRSEASSEDEPQSIKPARRKNFSGQSGLNSAVTLEIETVHIASKYEKSSSKLGALISLSDSEMGISETLAQEELSKNMNNTSLSVSGLTSKVDLESWLQSSSSNPPVSESNLDERHEVPSGYQMLSVKADNIEPKKYKLLDFTNGAGLEVEYYFSRTTSIYSQSMACVRLLFHNRSSETLLGVTVMALDSPDSVLEPSTSNLKASSL